MSKRIRKFREECDGRLTNREFRVMVHNWEIYDKTKRLRADYLKSKHYVSPSYNRGHKIWSIKAHTRLWHQNYI